MLGELHFQVQFAVVPHREEPKAAQKPARRTVRVKASAFSSSKTTSISVRFSVSGLEKMGYKVTLVANGPSALRVTNAAARSDRHRSEPARPQRPRPDAVRPPSRAGPHIPVIVVSASTGGFQMGKALEAGADRLSRQAAHDRGPDQGGRRGAQSLTSSQFFLRSGPFGQPGRGSFLLALRVEPLSAAAPRGDRNARRCCPPSASIDRVVERLLDCAARFESRVGQRSDRRRPTSPDELAGNLRVAYSSSHADSRPRFSR